MEKLIVKGGKKLIGELDVHGAKNSSLPILAAIILCENETILSNCPKLSDVDAACNILSYIGCKIHTDGSNIIVDPRDINKYDVPENLTRKMRSSIVFLGSIISKLGRARISFPGGCELGPRPIDLHLSSLKKLGVNIREEGGYLDCYIGDKGLVGAKISLSFPSVGPRPIDLHLSSLKKLGVNIREEGGYLDCYIGDKGLVGAKISLSFPSVGATENIILAAVKAKGRTTISNAAQEPEIVDLSNYLNKCGAKIYGAGKSVIVIDGVEKLYGTVYNIIPDRIVASTYLCCAAITGGELLLKNINCHDLESIVPIFEEAGCKITCNNDNIYLKGNNSINQIRCVRTMPYPGFPTDAQSPLLALSTISNGVSVFIENIFENRFKFTSELLRMGANIKVEGRVAVVEGVEKLHGANVECTDLRGGAALVIAALSAEGESVITQIDHIDRGYEKIEKNLRKIGANIIRE